MKKISCIIIDDDKLSLKTMHHMISSIDFLDLKMEFENALDAYNYLCKNTIDIVFLDVEMPDMTGLDLIRNLTERPIVILISSKKEYAADAFDLNLCDFLYKPVSLPRLMASASTAKKMIENKGENVDQLSNGEMEFLFIRSNSTLTKIKINDILYVQALGDYVNIYTVEKRYTIHITLSGLEEKLSSSKFYRLHRSFLIALNKIESIEENTSFVGQHPIPIGLHYKKELLQRLNIV